MRTLAEASVIGSMATSVASPSTTTERQLTERITVTAAAAAQAGDIAETIARVEHASRPRRVY